MIKRSFVTLTPEIVTPLYSTFVRPHLEYAIQASRPYLKKDIDHLERIQREATRMVKCCRGLSYEERLEKLSLFSLASRRLRGDLILAYNLANGSFKDKDTIEMYLAHVSIWRHARKITFSTESTHATTTGKYEKYQA